MIAIHPRGLRGFKINETSDKTLFLLIQHPITLPLKFASQFFLSANFQTVNHIVSNG